MKTLLFFLLLFLLAVNGVVLLKNWKSYAKTATDNPIAVCCKNLLPVETGVSGLPGSLMVLK
jgi:hypothetical protein